MSTDEIEEYLEKTYKDKLWIEPYANTALNSICDRWREENDVPWTDINQEAQDEIAFSTGKVPESPPCMSDAPSEADSMLANCIMTTILCPMVILKRLRYQNNDVQKSLLIWCN